MIARPPPGLYRYATQRMPGEGLRIGVTRHLPRGVRREDWPRRGYFDVWLPLIAPSAELLKEYRDGQVTWTVFARRYRAEMKQPACRQAIDLLAAFSHATPISLGCYCEDETRCHRTLLLPLVLKSRSFFLMPAEPLPPSSPPCYLAELDPPMDR